MDACPICGDYVLDYDGEEDEVSVDKLGNVHVLRSGGQLGTLTAAAHHTVQTIVLPGSLDYCIHGGKRYEEGDHFRPNGTIIKTESPEHCVQCRCHNGLVICEVEKCTVPNCETPIEEPAYCCLRCPEISKEPGGPSDFSFQNSSRKESKGTGCTSNGKYYAEGSVWQPVIGPLGVMSCVQCHCDKGLIVCKRYSCKEMPCSHPKNEFGKCCRVCPDYDTVGKGMKAECLPKSAEMLVFKTPKTGENSTRIEYAFLDGRVKRQTVQLHSWNTNFKGSKLLTLKTIPYKDFLTQNLKLLGATSYRRLRRFTKREEKLRYKCPTRCAKEVLRLERALKVYLVHLKRSCNEDEFDTANMWQFSPRR